MNMTDCGTLFGSRRGVGIGIGHRDADGALIRASKHAAASRKKRQEIGGNVRQKFNQEAQRFNQEGLRATGTG